jgi:polar amino acid transport system permease protein
LWNIYFGFVAMLLGFWLATALALGKHSRSLWLRLPSHYFVFLFRGSPLFIQFFLAYEAFVLLPKIGFEFEVFGTVFAAETRWLTRAWLGALLVLFFNTAAYSAEIFYGALKSIPFGEIEAADSFGMSSGKKFIRIIWPTMLRLAWPSYTNEAIFLFHATTLVFFSSFPAWRQKGDALYYASYLADKTFNPFIPYPILAGYFILVTVLIIWAFGRVNRRLNRHLPDGQLPKRSKFQFIR